MSINLSYKKLNYKVNLRTIPIKAHRALKAHTSTQTNPEKIGHFHQINSEEIRGNPYDRFCPSSFGMDRDRIIVILQEHAPELKAAGLVHLRVFGSVARGEASPQSDVDLMADFDKSKRVTLLTVGRLESRLGDLLGVKVDLSSADWMKEPVRRQALREAVVAF
jgi:predicted nucleotidyltransferase